MFWAEMLVAKHRMVRHDPEDFRLAYLEHEVLLMCRMSNHIEVVYRGTSSKVAGVEHASTSIRASTEARVALRNSKLSDIRLSVVIRTLSQSTMALFTAGRAPPGLHHESHDHAIQYPNGHVALPCNW
ncbi:hypothetical protein CDO29_17370 (plasmid) [Sinorhizobium meliloti]|nr:hypothetical protein CDO29_17370 [Sinorhizobium meliloti]